MLNRKRSGAGLRLYVSLMKLHLPRLLGVKMENLFLNNGCWKNPEIFDFLAFTKRKPQEKIQGVKIEKQSYDFYVLICFMGEN